MPPNLGRRPHTRSSVCDARVCSLVRRRGGLDFRECVRDLRSCSYRGCWRTGRARAWAGRFQPVLSAACISARAATRGSRARSSRSWAFRDPRAVADDHRACRRVARVARRRPDRQRAAGRKLTRMSGSGRSRGTGARACRAASTDRPDDGSLCADIASAGAAACAGRRCASPWN